MSFHWRYVGLRFDPIGGGQFKQALKQIIEAESQPIKKLEAKKAGEESRLKLFQDFKSRFSGIDKAINEVSSFKKLRELKVDLGDGSNIANVTLDKEKAQPGTYSIEISNLAEKSSVISNGFEDPNDAVLGTGFVVIYPKDGPKQEFYIDQSDSSLNKIANIINNDPKSAVQAAVVKDVSDPDKPWKLMMSAKKDGRPNDVEFPELYFLDGSKDIYFDDSKKSQNAEIKVDGFPIEAESNTISDFLPGVNLELKQPRPDHPFTMKIATDTQKVSGKMKSLVEQINNVLSFINQQNAIDENTDTRNTFAGDTGLQSIEYRIRNLTHEGFPVGDQDQENFRIFHLNDMGIEFDRKGNLTFKEDKFKKQLESDFEGVSEAISGPVGFAFQLQSVLSGYTRQDGGLTLREQGLRARIRDIDQQIESKQRIIDRRQQDLTEQFARLESSLSNLQRQQAYLSATLPGAGGGGNLVQQLLGG